MTEETGSTNIMIGGAAVSKYVAWTLGIVALILMGLVVYLYNKVPDYAGKVEIAKVAPEVAKLPMIDAPVKSVKIYAGGAVIKKKLSLPAQVVDNSKQQVIASSKVDASSNPHTVTTVINTDTGASETFTRTDPKPWLAYESRGAIGVYAGMKNSEQAIRIQAKYDVIQVKAFHAGIIGSIDRTNSGKTDSFIGAGAEFRFD